MTTNKVGDPSSVGVALEDYRALVKELVTNDAKKVSYGRGISLIDTEEADQLIDSGVSSFNNVIDELDLPAGLQFTVGVLRILEEERPWQLVAGPTRQTLSSVRNELSDVAINRLHAALQAYEGEGSGVSVEAVTSLFRAVVEDITSNPSVDFGTYARSSSVTEAERAKVSRLGCILVHSLSSADAKEFLENAKGIVDDEFGPRWSNGSNSERKEEIVQALDNAFRRTHGVGVKTGAGK